MLYQTERTYPLNQKKFNPITHRILRFRQLWKGGGVLLAWIQKTWLRLTN